MKNYTAEELITIVYGEKTPEKHTAKYNETREKLADMPQEKFDELYAAFNNGSSGIVGGGGAQCCKLSEEDVNLINKILMDVYHTHEFASVTDICCKVNPKGYHDPSASWFRTHVGWHYNNTPRFEVRLENLRRFMAKVLKELAAMGEVEQYAVKTCGKVHIYLYRAK